MPPVAVVCQEEAIEIDREIHASVGFESAKYAEEWRAGDALEHPARTFSRHI